MFSPFLSLFAIMTMCIRVSSCRLQRLITTSLVFVKNTIGIDMFTEVITPDTGHIN